MAMQKKHRSCAQGVRKLAEYARIGCGAKLRVGEYRAELCMALAQWSDAEGSSKLLASPRQPRSVVSGFAPTTRTLIGIPEKRGMKLIGSSQRSSEVNRPVWLPRWFRGSVDGSSEP
jgi:hypothetical protein